jgi:hypothetical protein
MTMHRRPLGRPRILAVVSAILMIVGSILPWWTSGGRDALPAISGNAFEGSGILVFVVALAVVALVSLPYAAGDRPVAADRWLSYLLLLGVGWIGLAARAVDLAIPGAFAFREPADVVTRGPGILIVVLGLALLSSAVFEMAGERRR